MIHFETKLNKITSLLMVRNSSIGKSVWAINGVLLIFFAHVFLSLLLSPYGILKDFTFAVWLIIQFLVGIFITRNNIKFVEFLDNIPLVMHLLVLVGLMFIYWTSIKHIFLKED